MVKDAGLHAQNLDRSAEILRALAHPLRLKIMAYIDKQRQTNVNSIYNTLKLEQSITSQHLRILRNANIVIARRDGKFIYYTLDYDRIDKVNELLKTFFGKN